MWGTDQQKAFEKMRDRLSKSPVLAYPNSERPFIVTTDASKMAVAAILSQVQDEIQRPIAYANRQLNAAESVYSASESELVALVWATKFFRCYLFGRRFLVRTNHAALSYVRNFAEHNGRMMRCL